MDQEREHPELTENARKIMETIARHNRDDKPFTMSELLLWLREDYG